MYPCELIQCHGAKSLLKPAAALQFGIVLMHRDLRSQWSAELQSKPLQHASCLIMPNAEPYSLTILWRMQPSLLRLPLDTATQGLKAVLGPLQRAGLLDWMLATCPSGHSGIATALRCQGTSVFLLYKGWGLVEHMYTALRVNRWLLQTLRALHFLCKSECPCWQLILCKCLLYWEASDTLG